MSKYKMDQAIRMRRSNIDISICQNCLGEHAKTYDFIYQIYRGEYEEVNQELKKLQSYSGEKII